MLFKIKTLKQIKSGEVTLAFRKWKRPTVRTGGTLKTPVGLLSMDGVNKIQMEDITDRDLLKAGYSEMSELQKELAKSSGSDIYKIVFRLTGPDPRIVLRNKVEMSEDEVEEISARLNKFDKSKRYPGWSGKVLNCIRQNPGKSASWISQDLRIEKDWLKSNIRKLKEMGLTISLEVGYQLSPRGNAYLLRRPS